MYMDEVELYNMHARISGARPDLQLLIKTLADRVDVLEREIAALKKLKKIDYRKHVDKKRKTQET
jgi:hypothetical protein